MIKTNLPVILLKGLVLLPNNDIRLEFDNDDSKSIVDVAELFHDNKVLVVNQTVNKDQAIKIDELPKIGVFSTISHKMELPNGKIRVVISGLYRMQVLEYLNTTQNNKVLESITTNLTRVNNLKQEIEAYTGKLKREVTNYVKQVPYANNNLAMTANEPDLDKLTDLIAPLLPISLDRLNKYLETNNAVLRAKMLLEDIYIEKENFNIEKEIDLKVKQNLDDNQKEYLLREKMKLIKQELGDSIPKEDEIAAFREKLMTLQADDNIKKRIEVEINRYDSLTLTSPESNIVRSYLDWMFSLPWNKKTIDDDNLIEVRKKLDESHYGLEKVKTRIIEFLAVKQMTNSLNGPIICLVGPPGTGKTSLAFSIAKAINRQFVKMSVGGVNDEAEIMGHRRTYLGANPGRIIQGMKKATSANPVFLIDEIDKMTKDIKGDPASALLEVLDPEQNKYFSDNYIEEPYNLSNVLFIATANYIEDIPEALKDRLEMVFLSGYTEYEKLDIANKHLIPKICQNHGLDKKNISINNNSILYIIRNYTKEAGVRELERQLATLIRKIVTKIVMEKEDKKQFLIDKQMIINYLGKEKYHFMYYNKTSRVGIVNGLAYTQYGGDTLPIEVNYFKGDGKLILTGSLGDVMKESAYIALNYIKANYQHFHIDYNKITKNDIHIHVPEGAIPKDGPSAGIALTTALISSLTGKKVPANIAMTGEITLRGSILPIGGLKEKSIGAHRNGINKIIIPKDNINDLDDVPNEIKKDIKYITVKNYTEVYNIVYNIL
ncbi:MAG: endopeptidase La [Bacilli bacterium]|nr:endopeptidase La [Bacilli bacterium]